jgi:Apea-like HEPN
MLNAIGYSRTCFFMAKNSTFEFHPAARETIERSANDLLRDVVEHAIQPNAPPEFPSERTVAARITDEEIIEAPMFFDNDVFGNTVARYFAKDGGIYGLAGETYQKLRRLADQILKTRWISRFAGRAYIEDHIFLWCRDNFGVERPQVLTNYLQQQISQDMRRTPVWVPVAFMEVEQEFQFGFAKLSPMTATFFDEYERKYTEGSPANADKIASLFSEKRTKYQGLAAVVLELDAVGPHAMQRAVELADYIVGLLRLYSPAAAVPWLICPSAIAGTEYVPSTTAISYGHDGTFRMNQGALKPLPYPWRISEKKWADISAHNLDALVELIEEDGLSDFQKRLRTSILTYSKGVTMREPADRLVYSLSALESLLLRDSSEPIQQNLGERLAFLLHQDPIERQNTVKILREAYGLRSRYVHHQKSIAEENVLEGFFTVAASALFGALGNVRSFVTTLDFINAIDRVKFGG